MPTASDRAGRRLVRVPVPPGPAGPAALLPALAAALDGSGPAIAPIPVVGQTVSNDYVMSLLAASRPEDDDVPLESDEVAVVMATSGSTGAPRGVLLTAAQLTSLTEAVNGPGATPQWIVALPVTSMGGFNVLVRALASGHEPVVVSSVGGAAPFTSADFVDAVDRASRTSDDVRVAVVPAQLSRLLTDDVGIDALRRCRSVLVGGAATRPSLRSSAHDLGIAITTTYGATETAGGCVYDGRPLPGVTVTADGSPGILTIDGPCVALGYRAEPDLTRRHFTERGFRTADLGEVQTDGSIQVVGRADDVVVVNGVNVSPTAIERVIADLPDIVGAATIVLPRRDGEARLYAFIEVRDQADGVEEVAGDEVVRRLGTAARPRVRRVDRLPHLPNGKVDRLALQTLATTEEN
jgi:O-succinylbenzoic acid--CoA ligase